MPLVNTISCQHISKAFRINLPEAVSLVPSFCLLPDSYEPEYVLGLHLISAVPRGFDKPFNKIVIEPLRDYLVQIDRPEIRIP